MKAILEFNLPDDSPEFELAISAAKAHHTLFEIDQWLRNKTKYAPNNISDDTYKAYEECREQLHLLASRNNLEL